MHAEFHAQFVLISRLTYNLRHEEYGFALIPHSSTLKTGVPPAEEKLGEENYENKANYVENVTWIQWSWNWMTKNLYKERLKIP